MISSSLVIMSSPIETSGPQLARLNAHSSPELSKLDNLTPGSIQIQATNSDGRPRGGTARTPGARTPRRVQWAQAVDDDDDARIKNRVKNEEKHILHSLDEAGVDPEAFRTLAQALERHRSKAPSPRPSSHLTQPAPTNYPHYPHTLPSVSEGDYFDPRISNESSSSSSDTVTPQQPVDVAFHGAVFVDPNERAGLPGPPAEGATVLVRAHTHRRRVFPSLPKLRLPTPHPKLAREQRAAVEDISDGPSDVEYAAASRPSRGVSVGGGILAALLALYDQDDQSDTYSMSSGHSTPASPRSLSRGRRRARSGERRQGASPAQSENATLTMYPRSPEMKSSPSRRFPLPEIGRALGLDSRPAKERNGAGVFGSLIATTGNIVGAAAPVSSTIAPNLKRPGYHLSRYSYEEPPTRNPRHSLRRSQSMRSLTLSRTSSMHASPSLPPFDSPASILSTNHPAHLERAATTSFDALQPRSASTDGPSYRSKWSEVLSLPRRSFNFSQSLPTTPGSVKTLGTQETEDTEEGEWQEKRRAVPKMGREKDTRDEQRRDRKRRKKKAEIFITRHIADLLARQTFVLKLARAMMMFGGPTHRLQAQMQSTARVLDISLSCMYLPDTMLLSFDDEITSTSSVKLIKQGSALDLSKLTYAYKVYWSVIHDEMSVREASAEFDELMRSRPTYRTPALVFFGGMASASICSVSFHGSIVDTLISFPLGCVLVAVQILTARHELYSNVFEITITTLISFIAAALADSHKICYSAVASASVVLILPGYLVLCGSLELSSRNIISGAVRLCYALIYSLFLGFGLAIGAEIYIKAAHRTSIYGAEDYYCESSHNPDIWYLATPSLWWAFLTVPSFSLFLSLRNHAPLFRKELPLLILISCAGWVTNHFTGTVFPSQSDINSAVGAFAVGIIANVYGRLFRGNAFVVMITGILFQLPSGLANGGLLTFANQQTSGNSSAYLSGFQTALQLISTCIGLTVGLGISLVIIFPTQSRKRAAGVFSL